MNGPTRLSVVMFLLLSGLIPSRASALFKTPTSYLSVTFNGLAWWQGVVRGDALSEAESTLVSQGYANSNFVQSDSLGETNYAYQFASALQSGFGALAISTHGLELPADSSNYGLPLIAFCRDPNVAGATLNQMIDDGVTALGEAFIEEVLVEVDSLHRQETYFAIGLEDSCLARISRPQNGIIYASICYGRRHENAWLNSGSGQGVFLGYEDICPSLVDLVDFDFFWQMLRGDIFDSRDRTVSAALAALSDSLLGTGLGTSAPASARDSLVLAPFIIAIQPPYPPRWSIDSDEPCYLQFDTSMHANDAEGDAAVTLSGQLQFYNASGGDDSPYWEQDSIVSYLSWHMFPRAKGSGTVTVDCSYLRSAGGIPLNTGDFAPPPRSNAILNFTYPTLDGSQATWIDHTRAVTDGGGNTISFQTHWEQYSDSFRVERIAGPSGPPIPKVPATGSGGPGVYQVVDSYGDATSRYLIVEEQTGGRPDREYGTIDAGPAFTVSYADSMFPGSDSLAVLLQASTNADSAEFLESLTVEGSPLYVLVAPDSMVTSLMYYRALWSNPPHNIPTSVVSMSDVDAHGGLQPYISWAYDQGTRYVLLVGDANDAAWWDDEGKWINGWKWPRIGASGPHHPSQPANNLIPTNYTADADSPHVAMSFYTPYYASDLPYADTNGDGLPEMRIGRLPVDSRAEVLAYTQKLASYLASTPRTSPKSASMTWAGNNGSSLGPIVARDADEVKAEFPLGADLGCVTDTTRWGLARRKFLADSVAATFPDRMYWIAAGAQRDIYGNFWRLDQGWSTDTLAVPSPAGRFFVSLGFSCGMGNFDQTEDYVSCDSLSDPTTCSTPIRPIPERLLLNSQRGAIAVVGPTRGTFQFGNTQFAKEMVRQLDVAGRDLGTAFMVAQANCMVKYPEYTDLFRSYVLLGDPMLGGPITTGVATSSPRIRPGLNAPRPNPFNPSTVLGVRLAVPGRAELRVYDVRGRLVRTLLKGELLTAGVTPVRWDGKNNSGSSVASGVYIARLNAAGSSFRQKLVLLK